MRKFIRLEIKKILLSETEEERVRRRETESGSELAGQKNRQKRRRLYFDITFAS